MSIPNLIHKIKSSINIDRLTVVYLLIIIGVGVSSFGLGRLSANNSNTDNNKDIITIKEADNPVGSLNTVNNVSLADRRYVASKNGKMYYGLNCAGAKRIKGENQIWFNTKEDAEKSGFTLSSTCN